MAKCCNSNETTGSVAKSHIVGDDIPDMNLEPIIMRVQMERGMRSERSKRRLKKAEREYREFWHRCRQDINMTHSPQGRDVDDIWHAHILHTKQYASDCQRYFGYFLHHTPKPISATTNALAERCSDRCASCDS